MCTEICTWVWLGATCVLRSVCDVWLGTTCVLRSVRGSGLDLRVYCDLYVVSNLALRVY